MPKVGNKKFSYDAKGMAEAAEEEMVQASKSLVDSLELDDDPGAELELINSKLHGEDSKDMDDQARLSLIKKRRGLEKQMELSRLRRRIEAVENGEERYPF